MSVAITDEFYIFGLMEIHTCKEPAAKLILTLDFKIKKFFSFCEGKTFPRNHKSQPNSSLEKWQSSFLISGGRARSNSDFMILDLHVDVMFYISKNVNT